MCRLSKLTFYSVSAFTAGLLALIGIFGQRCANVPISSVAFRPDGQEMLVVKLDGQVERWGGWPERAEYLYTTGDTGFLSDIAYSPDGKLIATSDRNSTVRLWDTKTGLPIRTLYPAANWGKESGYVWSYWNNIAIVAQGQIICGNTDNGLILWDVRDGTILQKYDVDPPAWRNAVCLPDGKSVIVDTNARIEIRDTKTRAILRSVDHKGSVENLIIAPDGSTFLAQGYDGIRVWDVKSTQLLRAIPANVDEVRWYSWLAYTPDRKGLVYSRENRLWLVDIASGAVLLDTTINTWIKGIRFAPDGKSFWINTDWAVYQFDTLTGQQLKSLKPMHYQDDRQFQVRIISTAISPDGLQVAAISDDKRIWMWDGQTGELERRFYGHTGSVRAAIYTPDGKRLITTGDDPITYLWDLETGNPLQSFERNWFLNRSMTIATNGKVAATLDRHGHDPQGGDVNLWDISTGKLIRTFSNAGRIVGSALSPDGSYLATVSNDGTFSLWGISSGKANLSWLLTNNTELYKDQALAVFSPNGRLISVAGKGVVRIISLDAGTVYLEHHFPETYSAQVTGLAFSPDGSTLAATFAGTGNQIYLWDTEGKLLKRMSHPGAHLTSLAFSPDGKTILTGSADGIPRLWDVETGTPQRVLCPNIISRRYSVAGWVGLFALIVVPVRAVRRFIRTR